MCYTIEVDRAAKFLEKEFKAKFKKEYNSNQLRISAFTFPETPVITNLNPETIELYSWGLIPSWSKDIGIRSKTLNAKIETILELPSYKNYVQNRCLIIATAFYEWQWLDSKGKQKRQYKITVEGNEVFAFAGIFNLWENPGSREILSTYSMVTTEANEIMAKIHNTKKRMPVILTHENQANWLYGTEIKNFAKLENHLIAAPLEEVQKGLFD